MKKTIQLAKNGQGKVSPNPMVGCVIIKNDKIIGKGWHEAFGEDHAEIVALREAGESAQGSTMYVNLEPCNCHSKTNNFISYIKQCITHRREKA